jgi:hypothetical protein
VADWLTVKPGSSWKAAGWLYRWVVGTIAENVDDDQLKLRLKAIVDENLPTLALSDFTEAECEAIRAVIRQRLVEDARAEFPADMSVDLVSEQTTTGSAFGKKRGAGTLLAGLSNLDEALGIFVAWATPI